MARRGEGVSRRSRFRVVQLGLGQAGTALHLPALRRLRDVDVVAACDPSPAARERATGIDVLADAGAALDVDADAVLVATPPATHAALALAAIDRGRHVYIEKPMATSVADATAIADRAREAGVTVQIGFAYRFHPLWQRVAGLRRRGRLELPVTADAVFDDRPGDGWAHPVLDVGLHHVDLMTVVCGAPPGEVEWRGGTALRAAWPDGSVLRGEYGPGPGDDRARMQFANATVDIDRRRGVRLRGAGLWPGVPSPALVRARPAATGWERSFERALRAFVASARAGRAATPGPAEGVAAVRVGEAILRSASVGERVTVDAVP